MNVRLAPPARQMTAGLRRLLADTALADTDPIEDEIVSVEHHPLPPIRRSSLQPQNAKVPIRHDSPEIDSGEASSIRTAAPLGPECYLRGLDADFSFGFSAGLAGNFRSYVPISTARPSFGIGLLSIHSTPWATRRR